MKNILGHLFVLALFICGCYDRRSEMEGVKPNLIVTGSSILMLGKSSIPFTDNFYLEASGKDRRFVFYNSKLKKVSVYKYPSNEIEAVFKVGISGLEDDLSISGIRFLNYDSIYLYNYSKSKLFLIDSSKKLVDSIQIGRKIVNDSVNSIYMFYPWPSVSSSSPIHYWGGNVCIAGSLSGESPYDSGYNRPVLSVFNHLERNMLYTMPYLRSYQVRNYGGYEHRKVYSALKDNELFVSFPITDSIAIYKLDSFTYRYKAPSPSRDPRTKYLNASKSTYAGDREVNDLYSSSDTYKELYYDKYKDVFYRVYEYAVLPRDLNRYGLGIKEFSVLVYNSELKYIGESDRLRGYASGISYIDENGIYFLNVKKSNDDKAYFDRFSFGH